MWTNECTQAIQKLKQIVSSDPVLKRPNHDKPFTLKCDASQYALGAVLSQRNDKGKLQTMGYYSKTLIPAERNYDVYDRELLALVRGLENWRHLLLGAQHQIEVFTDHDGLTKYQHAQKISCRVAWYLPVLWEYHILIKHRTGTANKVADALSRPPGTDEGSQDNQDVVVLPDHLFCRTITLDVFEHQIRSAQEAHSVWVFEQAEQQELEEAEGIWHKGGRAVVPPDENLRREILKNAHDHRTAGHPGIKKTLLAVIRNYWWPKMGEFVTNYVKGCGICQETKPGTAKALPPLIPIPSDPMSLPFQVIALDLIVDLPSSQGYDSILTITDHDVSKAAIFLPCSQTITGEGIATLFATHVFPHFGVPRKVISNRDTRFTSAFTTELLRILDVSKNMSTAYHPQTDGQSE